MKPFGDVEILCPLCWHHRWLVNMTYNETRGWWRCPRCRSGLTKKTLWEIPAHSIWELYGDALSD